MPAHAQRTKHRRWLDIRLRQLAIFEAVVADGSFRGAAKRLGYSQSAVSQHVAALEQLVGFRLLLRSPGNARVELTPAGASFLDLARQLVEHTQLAEENFARRMSGDARKRVVLGLLPSLGGLPVDVLALARQARAGVEVRLVDAPAERVASLLAAGELDLAFVEDAGALPDEVQSAPVLSDAYCIVGRGERFAAFRTAPHLERCLPEHDVPFSLSPQLRTDSLSILHGLVATGVAPALLPRLAVDVPQLSGSVEVRDAPLPPRPVAIAWHVWRELTPEMETVVKVAQDAGAKRSPSG